MAAFECKRYAWRSGYSYRVPASTVGGVLEKIEKEQGKVTSEALLDYSRDEKAETHELFEWNDSVAAEKYRLTQAGKVITQLEVSVTYEEPEHEEINVELTRSPQQVPKYTYSAYVNINKRATGSTASYVNTERAMSDKTTRKQVLENALQELRMFRRKYQTCRELTDVFDAIARLEMEELC